MTYRKNLETPDTAAELSWRRQLAQELEALQEENLYRRLRSIDGCQGSRREVDGHWVLVLAGADYLGLSGDPRVVAAAAEATERFGTSSGGARLISGNLPLHQELEQALAHFTRCEAALLFSTGYMANLGVLTALAGPDDVIVSDTLNHASIIDGCRLSRAEVRTFRHSDPDDLARVCRQLNGFRRRLLVVDGLFSMDGDVAPLADLVPIARQHDMLVIVDDAHGLGVLGPSGRGAVEQEQVTVDIQIGNLGKALASFGAFVCCSATLRDYLVNTSRPFIFTCGLPPAAAAAARASLDIVINEPQRRSVLMQRAEQLRQGLRSAGYDTGTSTTQIVPAIVGDDRAVMELCERGLERGIYAQGIRFPSVPRGTARLRFTPTCLHTESDIDEVVRVFAELAREVRG